MRLRHSMLRRPIQGRTPPHKAIHANIIPHRFHYLIRANAWRFATVPSGPPPPDTHPSRPPRKASMQRLCLPRPPSTWGLHADVISNLLWVAPKGGVSVCQRHGLAARDVVSIGNSSCRNFMETSSRPAPVPTKMRWRPSLPRPAGWPPSQYLSTLSSKHSWRT